MSEAATKGSPEQELAVKDAAVGLALDNHLRGWLAHRVTVAGARGAVTMTSVHRVEKPGRVWAAVGCLAKIPTVRDDLDVFAFARAYDDALPIQHGGRGRFLVTDLEQHADAVRCALNENKERLLEVCGSCVTADMLKHAIVDDKRVTYMILRDRDPALDVLRWMLR